MGAMVLNEVVYGGVQPYPATSTTLGFVKPDDVTVKIDVNGTLSIPNATEDTSGIVKPDGTTITVADGVISCHAPITTLPASSVTYDNETSKVTQTDVQSLLDSLVSQVADLTSRLETAEAELAKALVTES